MSATDFVRKKRAHPASAGRPAARPRREGRHDSMRVFPERGGRRRAMLVVMRQDARPEEIEGVVRAIEARGFKAHPIPGAQRTAIGITGNRGAVDRPVFESLPGVLEVIPVTHAYKLVSREVKPEDTVVRVGGRAGGRARVRRSRPGPCAVESLEQMLTVARGGQGGGGAPAARRGLQAAHEPVRLPGPRRGGAPDPRRRARGDGAPGRDRGARRRERRPRGALRRRDPDRRPQHAELLAAQAVRQGAQARAAQARASPRPSRSS